MENPLFAHTIYNACIVTRWPFAGLHIICNAVPLPISVLFLEFEDRRPRVVDLAPVIADALAAARKHGAQTSILNRLVDPAFFNRVRVDEEAGTVVCPDDVDIDADVLYHLRKPVALNTLQRLVLEAPSE